MELFTQEWMAKNLERSKIVLLHGLGGSGALWRPIAAELEDDYSIIAPDQRGHGKSFVDDISQNTFHPLDYASDVIETMTKRDFHPFTVIGHSMGARTACAVAQLRPDWVQGIVLVDLGLSPDQGGGFGKRLATFLKELPETFSSFQEAREFLMAKTPDPALAQYLLAVIRLASRKEGPVGFPFQREALYRTLESVRGISIEPWVKSFASQTGKPLLIFRGETSTVWSHQEFEETKRIFRNLPNVQFIEILGTGHGLPFEKRKEFCQHLRQFIKT